MEQNPLKKSDIADNKVIIDCVKALLAVKSLQGSFLNAYRTPFKVCSSWVPVTLRESPELFDPKAPIVLHPCYNAARNSLIQFMVFFFFLHKHNFEPSVRYLVQTTVSNIINKEQH